MQNESKEFFRILKAAAEALEDSRSPFNSEFLLEHDVSMDHCMAMSNVMSVLIQAYLKSPDWAKNGMLAAGIMPEEMTDYVWDSALMQRKK